MINPQQKQKIVKLMKSAIFTIAALTITTVIVKAGVLTPSASPSATSYTLTDIYNKIVNDTDATLANHDLSNSASPTATFYSLTQIYNALPDLQTLSASSETVTAGRYEATTLSTVDTDLTAGNILSGTTIFGVAGSYTGYTYGDNTAVKVLTTATGAGTYNASNLSDGVVKLGTSYGVSATGSLVPNSGTSAVADVFNGKTAHLTGDWNLDTGTLDLACNTSTFDASANLVANAYDGAGSGSNRWCMTDSGDAIASNILIGKTAWVDGQAVSGSMASQSLSSANQTVSAGYYSATTLSTVDTDLTAGNINSGTVIFGVTGTLSGAELHTGQTTSYRTGDDADLDGTSKSYTDNGDDTITDDQTGLIWQKYDQSTMAWNDAIDYCLGLTLGSSSDWHLPSYVEGGTMFDYACISASGSCYGAFRSTSLDWSNTTGFGYMWTSTTTNSNIDNAYYLIAPNGYSGNVAKTVSCSVRCVR